MSTVRIAQAEREKIRPAFVVQKLEGKAPREICHIDKDGKIVRKIVEADAGYLVTFPIKGNSIRVRTEKELKALGFDKTIPLVKIDGDDEVVGEIPNALDKKE